MVDLDVEMIACLYRKQEILGSRPLSGRTSCLEILIVEPM